MTNKVNWFPFDSGETIGTKGSEGGVIICDEEHIQEARITLEEGGEIPYSITCGIYGLMFLTNFAGTKQEANGNFEAMKADIDLFFEYLDTNSLSDKNASSYMNKWLDQFQNRFS